MGKESACIAGDTEDVNLIFQSEISLRDPNGNPLCILAWEIPWTEEPGGLQPIGSKKS